MGTPQFAVPSLAGLHGHHTVTAVFCQPDRPKGRSRKPVPCPVKEKALELGIPVHQPKRIKARKWVNLLNELAPDLIVVAAFGQLLSQKVLDVPRIACVNVHASLLPRWRGASPIHYAIKEGDERTGVGIMKMELALDAGPVYSEASVPLDHTTRRRDLEHTLAELGADLLVKTIPDLQNIEPRAQDEALVTYAPIIGKDFGYLDPAESTAEELDRAVRAFEEWPSVVTRFRETPVKWHRTRVVPAEGQAEPGTVALVSKKRLCVACAGENWLELLEVQPSGKKSQPVAAFVNGYQPKPGEPFEAMPRSGS
ncbi:MAG: methionyl-tRNA formyltransferase [Acidobacteriota bacterium]|nr:methionyl-tRNA formyltransferase [Acidobacteriota bacterium]